MKTPTDCYMTSTRPYRGLPELTYPVARPRCRHRRLRPCMRRKRINISHALAGQRVGIKEVDEGIWFVSFMQHDLGYLDSEQKTVQPLHNPFGMWV